MIKLTAPPADANGYWHYTYITYNPDTGEWYGGKHSTKDIDDGYMGSGNWIMNHLASDELLIEIMEFFESEAACYVAEASLVTWAIITDDALCQNEVPGGSGFTRETFATPRFRDALAKVYADPEWRRKMGEWHTRRVTDPEWQKRMRAGVARRDADPVYRANNLKVLARLHADPEFQRKLKEANKKLAADPEWIRKNREAGARNAANPEWQRKLREALELRNADPEFHRKLRENGAKRKANPEFIRMVTERLASQRTDLEFQRKYREGIARRSTDPEWRRKVSEAAIRREAKKRDAVATPEQLAEVEIEGAKYAGAD